MEIPPGGIPPGGEGPPPLKDEDVLCAIQVLALTNNRPPVLLFPLDNLPLTINLLVEGLRTAVGVCVREHGQDQNLINLMNAQMNGVKLAAKLLLDGVRPAEPSRIVKPNILTIPPFTKRPRG
jgi:hypothetical protein